MEMKDGKPEIHVQGSLRLHRRISMTTIHGGPERYPQITSSPVEPWLFVLQDEARRKLFLCRSLGDWPECSFAVLR